jgi:thioredoxin reductase
LLQTQWANEVGIVRDAGGYLITVPDLVRNGRCPAHWPLDREPYYLETSMPGLFAAGDVRHGSIKRFALAVALVIAIWQTDQSTAARRPRKASVLCGSRRVQ